MRCINCGRDNKLKDRIANNGRCYYCNHPFAFEPTDMRVKAKFTDPFFAKLLTDISAENTLFFTGQQFQYFLHKRLKGKSGNGGCGPLIPFFIFFHIILLAVPLFLWIINLLFVIVFYRVSISEDNNYQIRKAYLKTLIIYGICILVIGIFISIILDSFISFTLFTLLGMGSIYLGLITQINTKISQIIVVSENQVNQWLNRWQEINGSLYHLLSSPNTERFNPVNLGANSYSFDRVIVCDKPEIVQFLIRNNFHFENNCAVLSIDGYPQSIFNTVIEMLKRNPDLQVYGLHDASAKGVSLIHELRNNEQWFKDSSVNIYDLGISPKQILKNPKYVILNSQESASKAQRLPQEVKNNLTPEELTWLESGNFVELESFSPKILLQIISRGISLSALPNGYESFITLEDNSNLGTTGVYVYGIDSFG